MKQETNKEMDLLLRRLGRRDEATVSEADHLDADELSAYAENALPTAARARYTLHLAECASCRGLVVQLSSTAGVVAATDSVAGAGPSGFKRFLASLFTPMVLRYAAPALGLIVVAAIGFVVLRRDEAGKYVAQERSSPQQPVITPSAEPPRGYADTPTNTAVSPEKAVERQEKNQQPAPPPNTPPVVSSVEADLSKDKAAAQSKPEQQPATANEPPPAKPEPSASTEQNRGTADIEASKREVKELPTAAAPAASKVLQSAERDDRKTDNVARARRPADSISVQGGASVGSIQSENRYSTNTRSVSGRHFRKEGGVWIDTAYDSSKDAVTLTRGSDQYRALVADEPQIKTIAEALDGEIIVVWKGRTYRIR